MLLLSACMAASTACAQVGLAFYEQFGRKSYRVQRGTVSSTELRGAHIAASLRSPNQRPAGEGFLQSCSIGLALSGGGSVSASFAYGVLRELAEVELVDALGRKGSLLQQVDFLSTASGGGIAGALMVELFREPEVQNALRTPTANNVTDVLRKKLDSRLYKTTFGEKQITKKQIVAAIGAALSWWSTWGDGQLRLRRLRGHLPVAIYGVVGCERQTRLAEMNPAATTSAELPVPLWVPNATALGDGSRLPLTLTTLRKMGVVSIDGAAPACTGSSPAEWLSTELLAASMAFPGIGPMRLRTASGTSIDLVDGGIADNLAVWTALDLLQHDSAPPPRVRLLLIVDASTDAEAGIATAAKLPSANSYLGRLPSIQLSAQYPELSVLVEGRAREPMVEVVWLRLRDLRIEKEKVVQCQREELADTVPAGVARCASDQSWSVGAARFIDGLETSAAISPQTANALMGLGRRAVRRDTIMAAIQKALDRCVVSPPRPR